MTDREFDQYVLSLSVRDSDTRQAGFDLLCCNSGDLDNPAARIEHNAANAPCELLSGSIQACKQGHQEQRQRLRATHSFPIRLQESRVISQNSFSSALLRTRARIRPQVEVRRL